MNRKRYLTNVVSNWVQMAWAIVWGIVIEQSIGKLFLAGFIPGIILALLMGAYCTVRAGMKKELAPAQAMEDETA